ncbi:aminoacyl-histidine dipeptidase [Arsenophonus nasoniae]|uniref:Cytosol non-specific dipeptidase n=1 Tax=Arsenophonus nasoniae TaxID=638 RepID=D2U047_9GAMM|nr:aminoacyl-histidine dipeptidase [Arsenophonus nasoniae]QBY42426.1 Cytosol non-specific dipeptidase [Arsenophonus nasoniae]WGM06544.1 aminoacyl-histidine dipeptidase [Arsenophonus nasoniae]WGM11483.1 aminoacyl-histidine dipeptidase [Arsenophonus nasoniae]WGM16179.1 aminoacyl-histidine dipeptidase [Arsenophonus nasoniae]CBA73600.1 aminoacyl-histidine dipeptidase [Arsenophonus nasoniae]
MSELSQLSPQPLWDIFAQICAIPHPSGHEEALAAYIMQWAERKKLNVERDKVGNILIRKPATAGMENLLPVVLQAHLDMVPQKNGDTQHDFIQDPIRPYVDNEWVKAQGTTLGADNGIGMASALAVLDDENIKHGPLEVLLTMTEETGMVGAFGLQPNWLQADILINTDSEQEGEIYMGCAGGVDFTTTFTLAREAIPANHKVYKITLKGLTGGHSGGDIHLGLANANKLLARFLTGHGSELQLRLIHIQGGSLRNAIPRESEAIVVVPISIAANLETSKNHYLTLLKTEFAAIEKNLVITLDETSTELLTLTADCQSRLLNFLNAAPNGVIRMSDEIKDVVETSLNTGVINMDEKKAEITFLIRSLIETGKDYVVNMLTSISMLAGAEFEYKGSYPGWKPDLKSPVMAIVSNTYQQLFGKAPKIMVIHAGLECGLFKKPYPQMDMVSIGPTIYGAHSPDERANIKSVAKYWQLLTSVLKSIPEKS